LKTARALLRRAITSEIRVKREQDESTEHAEFIARKVLQHSMERDEYARDVASTIIQNKLARVWLAKEKVRRLKVIANYKKRKIAATTVQSSARGFIARREKRRQLAYVITIQKYARRLVAKTKVREMKETSK